MHQSRVNRQELVRGTYLVCRYWAKEGKLGQLILAFSRSRLSSRSCLRFPSSKPIYVVSFKRINVGVSTDRRDELRTARESDKAKSERKRSEGAFLTFRR